VFGFLFLSSVLCSWAALYTALLQKATFFYAGVNVRANLIVGRHGSCGSGSTLVMAARWETMVRPQATNAASPREGGTSEVHRPQHSQQAAASAHPQAGSDRTPPHLREGLNKLTN
jgi:hypothetical protein